MKKMMEKVLYAPNREIYMEKIQNKYIEASIAPKQTRKPRKRVEKERPFTSQELRAVLLGLPTPRYITPRLWLDLERTRKGLGWLGGMWRREGIRGMEDQGR